MKKLITGLQIILILLFTPTIASASMGDTVLRQGSRGSDVVELQTKLSLVGINVGTADGIFGNLTRQGVLKFQLAHNLNADGLVGKLTTRELNITSIIATSKQYLGVKYVWGGSIPAGFDCSGFTSYVFAKNGITLPRVSRDQYKIGTAVAFENLQAGDLVFFSFAKNGVVDHVGIYLGDRQFINASLSKGVTIYSIGDYWKSVYVGARRIL